MRENDLIVGIDGLSYAGLNGAARIAMFGEEVRSHKCAGKPTDGCAATVPVKVTIRRGGKIETVDVTPHYSEAEGHMLMGVSWFEESRWAPVSAGDCVVIPPGTPHKLWNTGDTPLVLLCCCAPAYAHEDTVMTGR